MSPPGVEPPRKPDILVDADGCPVKQEVYRVARRYELEVRLVSNAPLRTPDDERVELIRVKGRFDAADDWIAAHALRNDIVITADIPLAARCVSGGARVLSPAGRVFREENIGEALAARELMSHLRDLGNITPGPAPFDRKDRSRFLQRLDDLVQKSLKG